jgi:uncharacterized protein YyaL (SSP411 family)
MFLPNRALLGAAEGTDIDELATFAPPAGGKATLSGSPTAYVCELGACRLPVTDPAALVAQLDELLAQRKGS